MRHIKKAKLIISILALAVFSATSAYCLISVVDKEEVRKKDTERLQQEFSWWPTDARPGPVVDKEKGGYWWWPKNPGPNSGKVWGNRGYCYVRKIIFDYKEEELAPPQPQEMRPSLLVRKIIKNVKIYFDYDKAEIRDDAIPALEESLRALEKNPTATILITGNCDIRGSEKYNEKLGKRRGESVNQFMLERGIPEDRIKIVSRGKLDAIAPVTDLVGMQKDRNAQFMVAEVEEVMMQYGGKPSEDAVAAGEGRYIEEKEETIEGQVKVSTKEYEIQAGDSLWKIAQAEMGSGHRWKYLYEFNKDRIRNPNKLRKGTVIFIPIE